MTFLSAAIVLPVLAVFTGTFVQEVVVPTIKFLAT